MYYSTLFKRELINSFGLFRRRVFVLFRYFLSAMYRVAPPHSSTSIVTLCFRGSRFLIHCLSLSHTHTLRSGCFFSRYTPAALESSARNFSTPTKLFPVRFRVFFHSIHALLLGLSIFFLYAGAALFLLFAFVCLFSVTFSSTRCFSPTIFCFCVGISFRSSL